LKSHLEEEEEKGDGERENTTSKRQTDKRGENLAGNAA